MKRDIGYYWLVNDHSLDDPTLAFYYENPDTDEWGFGFNYADGGGFLPEKDLTVDTRVVKAKVEMEDE